ncbi:hypothetical protein ACVW17_005208 [Bradyrhizobium sp. USDA 4473]
MKRSDLANLLIGLVVLAAAVALPFYVDSRYVIGQVTLGLFYAIVASQWNLLFGFSGVFSLAQMALFGFGGYATAMLCFYFGLNVWAAMPLAAIATVLFSLVIGAACLRLSGAYTALLTLAVAQVMYLLIVTDTDCFVMVGTQCRQLTGGAVGFARFGDLGTRAMFKAKFLVADYALVVALFAITMLFTWAIIRGPIGLAFRALRDNPGCAMDPRHQPLPDAIAGVRPVGVLHRARRRALCRAFQCDRPRRAVVLAAVLHHRDGGGGRHRPSLGAAGRRHRAGRRRRGDARDRRIPLARARHHHRRCHGADAERPDRLV